MPSDFIFHRIYYRISYTKNKAKTIKTSLLTQREIQVRTVLKSLS